MPCMCGDLYCYSCGPAQGNFQCGHCGKWSLDINLGWIKRQWYKLTGRLECGCVIKKIRAEEEQLAKELEEAERLSEEYWRNQP
jgi:hypothetical protein